MSHNTTFLLRLRNALFSFQFALIKTYFQLGSEAIKQAASDSVEW